MRFVEINMNGLDLMKIKGYTRSNPGRQLIDGRMRATLVGQGGAMANLAGVVVPWPTLPVRAGWQLCCPFLDDL
jgi:hypothetical protein